MNYAGWRYIMLNACLNPKIWFDISKTLNATTTILLVSDARLLWTLSVVILFGKIAFKPKYETADNAWEIDFPRFTVNMKQFLLILYTFYISYQMHLNEYITSFLDLLQIRLTFYHFGPSFKKIPFTPLDIVVLQDWSIMQFYLICYFFVRWIFVVEKQVNLMKIFAAFLLGRHQSQHPKYNYCKCYSVTDLNIAVAPIALWGLFTAYKLLLAITGCPHLESMVREKNNEVINDGKSVLSEIFHLAVTKIINVHTILVLSRPFSQIIKRAKCLIERKQWLIVL